MAQLITNGKLLISIEGNIGAGKTTLLAELEKHITTTNGRIRLLKEPVDEWAAVKDAVTGETLLAKFYKEPMAHAFSFQILAFTTRLAILKQALADPVCEIIICERSLEADENVFAKMLFDDSFISSTDYQIYQLLTMSNKTANTSVNGIVYLNVDPTVCLERIGRRSRLGESGISLDYLVKCKQYHDDWLNGFSPILVLDGSKDGFISEHVQTILTWIDELR